MTCRIRHLPNAVLRSCSLLLLLLCLITQPVLAAWGEMHALTAHADLVDPGLDHRAAHSDTAVDEGDADDLIHELSHHAHCCGQAQLPLLSQLSLPLYEFSTTTPWPAMTRAIAMSHFSTPFRPPILG